MSEPITGKLVSSRRFTPSVVGIVVLKVIIPTAVLWFVTENVNWPEVIGLLARMSGNSIIIALVLITVQNLLAAMRWRLIMVNISANALIFSSALKYLFVGLFVNQAMPSSIGGDAARIWLAYRNGVVLIDAVNGVAIDRILTMLALILIIVVGLPLMEARVPGIPGKMAFVAMLAGVLAVYVALVGLHRLAPVFAHVRRLNRIFDMFVQIRWYLLSWRKSAPVIAIAICGFTLMTFIVYVLAWGLRVELSLFDCFVFCPPVFLLAALPISIAGWGVRETAMIVALGYVGVSSEAAIVLSIAMGLVVLVGSLPGVLWLSQLFGRRNKKQ